MAKFNFKRSVETTIKSEVLTDEAYNQMFLNDKLLVNLLESFGIQVKFTSRTVNGKTFVNVDGRTAIEDLNALK